MGELMWIWVLLCGGLLLLAWAIDSSGRAVGIERRGPKVDEPKPDQRSKDWDEKSPWARESNNSKKTTTHDDPTSTLRSQISDFQEQISRLKSAGRKVINQRDTALAETIKLKYDIDFLKIQLSTAEKNSHQKPNGSRDKFRDAKNSFARLYHPDKINSSGFERTLREQVFKEFWAEIERIEKN